MSNQRRCRYSAECGTRAVALSQSPEYSVAESSKNWD